jgi:gas vesicle protein
MADYNDRYESEGSGAGFMMGLLTGTVLGAGLGMLLAPKAGSELRGTIGEQARNLGSMAQEQYKRATESAGTWAEKGREFVDRTRDAVSRGAEEAREYTGSTGSTASGDFGSTGSTGSTGTTGRSSSTGEFGRS